MSHMASASGSEGGPYTVEDVRQAFSDAGISLISKRPGGSDSVDGMRILVNSDATVLVAVVETGEEIEEAGASSLLDGYEFSRTFKRNVAVFHTGTAVERAVKLALESLP